MDVETIIIIDHSEPVPSILFTDLLASVEYCVRRANQLFLERLEADYGLLPEELLGHVNREALGDRRAYFYIEGIEAGSIKLHGRSKNWVIATLMTVTGVFATGVITKTQAYQKVEAAAVEHSDRFIAAVSEAVETGWQTAGSTRVTFERQGDSIVLRVQIEVPEAQALPSTPGTK